jgi:hypothetical protein
LLLLLIVKFFATGEAAKDASSIVLPVDKLPVQLAWIEVGARIFASKVTGWN